MKTLVYFLSLIVTLSLTSCVVHTRTAPAQITVVKRPAKYKVVHVKGKRYYTWNGRYHKKTRKGYVVVSI